jgi:hypothetical protein
MSPERADSRKCLDASWLDRSNRALNQVRIELHHEKQSTAGHIRFWIIKIAATTLGETGGDAPSDKRRTMILEG